MESSELPPAHAFQRWYYEYGFKAAARDGDRAPEGPSAWHAFRPGATGGPSWRCSHIEGGTVCGRDEHHHFHRPPDILAQVMEALSVERPEDVPGALAKDRAVYRSLGETAQRLARERDECRREAERLKAEVHAEVELQDEYAAWATRLANVAIRRLNAPVTEEAHTELWELALNALETPAAWPDPLVLLDLVDQHAAQHDAKAAARVHGLRSAMSIHKANADALRARIAALVPQQPVQARDMPDPMVRKEAEPAPPSWWERMTKLDALDQETEPRPRTAAEVWAGLNDAQAVLRERPGFRWLVEALDREAGLS